MGPMLAVCSVLEGFEGKAKSESGDKKHQTLSCNPELSRMVSMLSAALGFLGELNGNKRDNSDKN